MGGWDALSDERDEGGGRGRRGGLVDRVGLTDRKDVKMFQKIIKLTWDLGGRDDLFTHDDDFHIRLVD